MKRLNRMALAFLLSKDNQDIYQINEYALSFLRNILLYLGTIIVMGLTSWPVFVVGGTLLLFNLLVMKYYRKAEMELFEITIPFRS